MDEFERFNLTALFTINESSYEQDWKEIQNKCTYLSDWSLSVLKDGLNDKVKSVVYEPYYICKDHRNLYSNYYSKKFVNSSRYTNRLHFFSDTITSIDDVILNYEEYQNSYIGYSVIRPVSQLSLGRTIIDPFKVRNIEEDKFYCLSTSFKTYIHGAEYNAVGFPYTCQDHDVTVCAHAALWSMCRYLSEKYSIYKEVYPFDLIELTTTQFGRVYPHRGMNFTDYCKILSDIGAFPLYFTLKENDESTDIIPEEFQKMCIYLESGFPLLASFSGHVVILIGHTLDFKKPIETTDLFIDSSYFIKQFVINDDNYFPYQLLGFSGDSENYSDEYNINSINTIVCPLPEKVFLRAEHARKKAIIEFTKHQERINKFCEKPWVVRFYLTTNSTYKKRLLDSISGKDIDKITSILLTLRMPHFIWVMELSSVDHYLNHKCDAMIIIDSSSSILDNSVLYLRIGNFVKIGEREVEHSTEPTTFPQFTHNLGERHYAES